jgi:hypothetical protein
MHGMEKWPVATDKESALTRNALSKPFWAVTLLAVTYTHD